MGGWSLRGDHPLNEEFERALNAETYARVSDLADPSVLRLLRERNSVDAARAAAGRAETQEDVRDDEKEVLRSSGAPPLPKRRR